MASGSELYTYEAPFPLYSLSWCNRKDTPLRLAAGSFIEDYNNKVQVVELDKDQNQLVLKAQFEHPYPATKIGWLPHKDDTDFPDLLATSGDYLRIWKMSEDASQCHLECLLNNNKTTEFCAPLTSFDWCPSNPALIVTSSIDTTCCVWNLNVGKEVGRTGGDVKVQLIAHENEVYDVAFGHDENVFASIGADGSIRTFDLRQLEHSTIIYEEQDSKPLLRLAWNKQDSNYIAALRMDDGNVFIIDTRVPCVPVATMESHSQPCNSICWAPHSSCHIVTGSDDKNALIWDLQNIPQNKPDPILAYEAGGAINQAQWCASNTNWIAIDFDKKIEVLRV